MQLNIQPILKALARNRTGAVLVALQIALALAILVNATCVVAQRVAAMNPPTGIDEANMFAIAANGFTGRYDYATSVRDDLTYLRGLDGVIAATVSTNIPLSGGGNSAPLYRSAERNASTEVNAFMTEIDEQGIETYGARLLAGRNFRKEEIMTPMSAENQARPITQIIVTEELARALFKDGKAVGRTVYDPLGRPTTIIGVISDIAGPWTNPSWQRGTFLVPEQPLLYGFNYLVRTQPGRRDEIMRRAEDYLSGSNVDRIIRSVRSVELYKQSLFLSDRVTAIFLVTVTVLLLAVAALGIFGLATFNVSTRTKQIGTRRALGARKRDIIRHFLVENALVSTSGIVLGCALALAVGYWLSLQYQLPRLNLYYLVGGVLLLWVLGQLAAWQPARRAASVPPSVATRTA